MTVDEIIGLYESRGARKYGNEPVSQLEHALQCAALAHAANASAELIAAAFLHDLGHLVTEPAPDSGDDNYHQYLAIPFLYGKFSDAVIEPIRLHVDAKRLLSQKLTKLEAEFFLARPHAWDAVQLQRWDDNARVPGEATPPLRDVKVLLQSLEL